MATAVLVSLAVAGLVLGVTLSGNDTVSGSSTGASPPGPWDWPTYGHDPLHSFHGRTTLTPSTAAALRPAWSFPTGDAVTATPTVVRGVVYVGSWDGNFYALDLRTGHLRWKFKLDAQPAVSPQPGAAHRDVTSDGGLVTSSAWYEPGAGSRPDLVIFGGGYTLYALVASNGRLYWHHAYTGRPDRPPDPSDDDTRIFSSPVVVGRDVIFAVTPDGHRGYRGYIAAADLSTGDPVWVYQTDVDASGHILNDGCGGVWSSGTILARTGLVVFDVADCHFSNPPPASESVVALHADTGKKAWSFRPARVDPGCDTDFGATANAATGASGSPSFLGVGSKDGTYYSLDPGTGALRWSTNVVFGGFSGGFIATTAYDGTRVYGSTALGDYGRFEGVGMKRCDPTNPRDTTLQEPSVHAFDAATGRIDWQATNEPSFAPTTVAGGMTFNGPALDPVVVVRDAATGSVLNRLPLSALCWSGIATVGNAVLVGTGASQQGHPDGVVAFTPGGVPPAVPSGG